MASSPLSPRLRRLIALTLVAACATWAGALLVGVLGGRPSLLRLAAVLALAVAGDAANVTVRLGAHRRTVAAAEAGLLLGFVIAPAWMVVVVTAPALGVWELIRRERTRAQAAYNVAAATVATGAAAAAAASTGARGAGVSSWPGLAVVAVTFVVLLGLFISAAVARATGRRTLAVFGEGMLNRGVVAGGSLTVVLALLAAWDYDRGLLIMLPVLLVISATGLRRFLGDRDELDALRRLDLATRSIPGLDMVQVLSLVCGRTAELFGTSEVDVLVLEPYPRRFIGGADAGWAPLTPDAAEDAARLTLATHDAAGGTAIVAPLSTGSVHLGALRVRVASASVTRREEYLLTALATTAAGALLNAEMHLEVSLHAEALAEAAADLRHRALHDPLTGLGNRNKFLEVGEEMLGRDAEAIEAVLMLIDLDHFKEVNDALGHAAGDALLCAVAMALVEAAPSESLVVRLGGDEFAVLMPGTSLSGPPEAEALTLAGRLREPVRIDGVRLSVEGSIGVACAPTDATSVEELLRCADVAMYQAKRAGVVVRRYAPASDDTSTERLTVLAELRAAIPRGEIEVYYQPKIRLGSTEPYGAEALCRWHHPTRGMLMPGAFIPVAEHSSMISALTEHILEVAIRDAAIWRTAGLELQVAVNVSPRNLLDDGLPEMIGASLRRHGLPPRLLVLEITETLALTELDTVESVLRRLRAGGVHLSVDDFGTGYSSLTFLQQMDVNEVKIDRSFVSQLPGSSDAQAIVAATVDLAHRLQLSCVAEGVETLEQQEMLTQLGCDAAQGYLFARPMSFVDIEPWVRSHGWKAIDIPLQPVAAGSFSGVHHGEGFGH